MLTDDPTLASAQMMDGDMQVNQAAYNYNAWYQVGACFGSFIQHTHSEYMHVVVFPVTFLCGPVSVDEESLE